MNINLITYFNVALKNNGSKANDKTFEEVNSESAKYGWLIHPDCCNADTLKWVLTVARIQYNKTFYKKWEDITSKTRFELLMDQIRHYASTYGTGMTEGEGYMPNHEDTVIPFEEFKVIMPVTEQELFDRCAGMLTSGIALKEETQHDVVAYVIEHTANWSDWNFSLDEVKNKEAQATIACATKKYPNDSFGLLRCLVYQATGSTMLIKSKSAINEIKNGSDKIDLTKLSETQVVNLSKIFHRYKPLFLAMKNKGVKNTTMTSEAFKKAMKKAGIEKIVKGASNSSVVNKLRKLANTHHTPLVKGFWETVISDKKSIEDVKAKVGEITNFKKITLMQCIKERLANQNGQCFIIRNGKLWVRQDYKAKSDATYLMNLYLVLQNSLVESIKDKACTVRYPKGINLTIPTSEKNFIGNYPIGSYVNMGDDHNVIGIYWENDWHTRDFDLHLQDMEGNAYGWNAGYHRDNGRTKVIFSGDITNAPNGATELFYIGGKAEDGIVSVNRFSGDGEDSQFKFFIAQDNTLANKEDFWARKSGRNYMLDPNKVVAEYMIPVPKESSQTSCAIIVDNKFVLMDTKSGNRRVPNRDLNQVIIDKFKVKARAFVELREILEAAGFTEAPADAEEVGLDLTQISKDTLINLFA